LPLHQMPLPQRTGQAFGRTSQRESRVLTERCPDPRMGSAAYQCPSHLCDRPLLRASSNDLTCDCASPSCLMDCVHHDAAAATSSAHSSLLRGARVRTLRAHSRNDQVGVKRGRWIAPVRSCRVGVARPPSRRAGREGRCVGGEAGIVDLRAARPVSKPAPRRTSGCDVGRAASEHCRDRKFQARGRATGKGAGGSLAGAAPTWHGTREAGHRTRRHAPRPHGRQRVGRAFNPLATATV